MMSYLVSNVGGNLDGKHPTLDLIYFMCLYCFMQAHDFLQFNFIQYELLLFVTTKTRKRNHRE